METQNNLGNSLQPVPVPSPHHGRKQSLLVALFLLLVLLTVGVWVWYKNITNIPEPTAVIPHKNNPITVTPLPANFKTEAAPKEKLPTGFPPALMLYPNIKPVAGNATNPGNGVTQYVTEFYIPSTTPNSKISAVLQNYQTTLTKAGWKQGSPINTADTAYGIFRKSQPAYTEVLEVTAEPFNGDTKVSLDYYQQPNTK